MAKSFSRDGHTRNGYGYNPVAQRKVDKQRRHRQPERKTDYRRLGFAAAGFQIEELSSISRPVHSEKTRAALRSIAGTAIARTTSNFDHLRERSYSVPIISEYRALSLFYQYFKNSNELDARGHFNEIVAEYALNINSQNHKVTTILEDIDIWTDNRDSSINHIGVRLLGDGRETLIDEMIGVGSGFRAQNVAGIVDTRNIDPHLNLIRAPARVAGAYASHLQVGLASFKKYEGSQITFGQAFVD